MSLAYFCLLSAEDTSIRTLAASALVSTVQPEEIGELIHKLSMKDPRLLLRDILECVVFPCASRHESLASTVRREVEAVAADWPVTTLHMAGMALLRALCTEPLACGSESSFLSQACRWSAQEIIASRLVPRSQRDLRGLLDDFFSVPDVAAIQAACSEQAAARAISLEKALERSTSERESDEPGPHSARQPLPDVPEKRVVPAEKKSEPVLDEEGTDDEFSQEPGDSFGLDDELSEGTETPLGSTFDFAKKESAGGPKRTIDLSGDKSVVGGALSPLGVIREMMAGEESEEEPEAPAPTPQASQAPAMPSFGRAAPGMQHDASSPLPASSVSSDDVYRRRSRVALSKMPPGWNTANDAAVELEEEEAGKRSRRAGISSYTSDTRQQLGFEANLSPEAGKPGPVETLIAKSRGVMKLLHHTLSLRAVPLLVTVDTVIDFFYEYARRALRFLKSLRAAARRRRRLREGTMIQEMADDFFSNRTRLARLFGFPGFLQEASWGKYGFGKEQQLVGERTFLLAMVLEVRQQLDDMKHDVDALLTFGEKIGQFRRSMWGYVKDFFGSVLPNPLAFLGAWKDLLVMGFGMRYPQEALVQSYRAFLWSYTRLLVEQWRLLRLEAGESIEGFEAALPPYLLDLDPWELPEGVESVNESLAAMEGEHEVRQLVNEVQWHLERFLRALCFPARVLEPKRWPRVALLFAQRMSLEGQLHYPWTSLEFEAYWRREVARKLPKEVSLQPDEERQREAEELHYTARRKLFREVEKQIGPWR